MQWGYPYVKHQPKSNTVRVVTARVCYIPSGSLMSHKINYEELWDRAYGLLSLSEKPRKPNHLQMSLQRKHFLLSYLKTLRVGLAGVWTQDLLQLSQPGGSQFGTIIRASSLLHAVGALIANISILSCKIYMLSCSFSHSFKFCPF